MKLRGLLFLGYKQGINKQHYPSFLRAVAAPVGVVGSACRVEVSAIITKSVIIGVEVSGLLGAVGVVALIGALVVIPLFFEPHYFLTLCNRFIGEVANHRDKVVNRFIFFAQHLIVKLLALFVHCRALLREFEL